MSRSLFVSFLLLGMGLAAGCGADGQGSQDLPPARGEGAPERAELPSLPDPADEGPEQAAASADQTTGTTYPADSSKVGPNVSGIIASVEVDEGDVVERGQILFRLRRGDFALRLQQAQAALKSAQVQARAAKVEHDRIERLLDKNAIDQARFDRVQAEYQAAQAGVAQAQVAVDMARKALADATVRAPFDGVVTAVLKSAGEMVAMMPPTPVVVVEDHSQLELKLRLPERALSWLNLGDVVTARFEALETAREAEIARISPNVDPRTRTVEVMALIDNEDGALKPGMLAEVDLARERKAQKEAVADEQTDEEPEEAAP